MLLIEISFFMFRTFPSKRYHVESTRQRLILLKNDFFSKNNLKHTIGEVTKLGYVKEDNRSVLRVNLLLRNIFRGILNKAVSTNKITSFRFPQKIFSKKKLFHNLVCSIVRWTHVGWTKYNKSRVSQKNRNRKWNKINISTIFINLIEVSKYQN